MNPRVLFTASTPSHIRNFHLPYLRRFQELGFAVDVACGAPVGEILYADQVIPLPLQKKITALDNWKAVGILKKRFRQIPYSLVITHTSLAAFFTRLALPRGSSRPAVVNMVHGYLFDLQNPSVKDRLLFFAERLTANRTDLALTMNAQDFEVALRFRLGDRVKSVPGVGVDFTSLDDAFSVSSPSLSCHSPTLSSRPSRHAPTSSLFLSCHLSVPENAFCLLYAAEFSPRKNQAFLIRSLVKLPDHVHLLLPGQGALLEDCKKLAYDLGLSQRVHFPGQVGNIAPWYAMADAAVSSSRSEGLPFNIMEAMYAGLPIVASNVKGHTDLLTDGQTGLLYSLGSPDGFVDAVLHLLADPDQAQRMGQAAHQAVLPYSLPQVLPQVMEAYLSVLPAELRSQAPTYAGTAQR